MKEKKIQVIVHKGPGELKHKEIVDKLMSKCDSTGAAMNMVLDIVGEQIKDDTKGVKRFMKKINDEVETTEGQDCLLVNDILFDWKELSRPEIVGELVDLALNCMSNETSRKKLETMLNK